MCVPPRSTTSVSATAAVVSIAEVTPTTAEVVVETTIPSPSTTPLTSENGNNYDVPLLSWKEQRQRKIDLLNQRVARLTKIETVNATKSGKQLDPEYVYAQEKMTILKAGTPIYQMRSATMVYLYSMSAFGLVASGALKTSPLATFLSVVVIFLGYDLYSGVLHVVLDHPNNIAAPVLGQPCLEFQWHHAIPDDLVRKDFVDVCGDLNVAIFFLTVINCYLLVDLSSGKIDASGVAMVVGGMKLLMAYFGQFSHRSAHSFGTERYSIADWLQKQGIMISPKDHLSHHKPPHDTDFCLIGLCNPIIDLMRQITTSNVIWLTMFFTLSIFDVVLYVKFIEWMVPPSS